MSWKNQREWIISVFVGVFHASGVLIAGTANCEPGYHTVDQPARGIIINMIITTFTPFPPFGGNGSVCAPDNPAPSSVAPPPGGNVGASDSPAVPPAGMDPKTFNAMLDAAQQAVNAAAAKLNLANLALESCRASAEATEYLQHSPGYTGKGAGFDRHAKLVKKNCKAQLDAYDAAWKEWANALEQLQDLKDMQNQNGRKSHHRYGSQQ